MNNFQLKYLICDTEVLEDYFSLQLKNESDDKVMIFECYDDTDIISLYHDVICNINRPMYIYAIDYDKVIINALCKFVEKGTENIVYNLRKVSDYLIKNRLDYFQLNREFWCNHYFKYKENCPEEEGNDLFQRSVNAFCHLETEFNFLNEFPELMGKSKVYKKLIINSIPKIMYYFTIRDGKIIPTISLKKLQLINEGYNVTFDLGKYTRISDIKKDNLYDKWMQYSENDVKSLEKIFLGKVKDDIMKRYYALEAIKMIDNSFEINERVLYSENNTELITSILKLPEDEINKNIKINYNHYIQTNYKDFNDFVYFVNEFQETEKDSELKNNYCNFKEKEYIEDDKNILEDGKASKQVGSVDEIIIENKHNNITCKIGLGGIHGALNNYIESNMLHFDYTSQYPSIILQYKELFKNIINIPLYEAVYKMRVESKPELKKLKQENEKWLNRIHESGNDAADIAEYEAIGLNEKIERLDNIVNGLKLILNSSYGLINSNFNLPISCKVLGRFICLKGQSMILNLCDKLKQGYKLININTDGVIAKSLNIIESDVKIEDDGYFVLGIDKIDKIIQKDVNSYIKDGRTKGQYNVSIKQIIAKNEKLAVNIQNAVRLIQGKQVEVKPIYFDKKYFEQSDKAYYFTSKELGEIVIKNVKKPEIIGIEGENIYFTDDRDKARIEMYQKYAKLVHNQILEFKLGTGENKNNKYFEVKLESDLDENNKLKRQYKRRLAKIFGTDQIGMVGFKGHNKSNSYLNKSPIKPLIQYTMTQILNSTSCSGFSVENNKYNSETPFIIIDVDIFDKNTGKCKEDWKICSNILKVLKHSNTFECWNLKTIRYNRKYIFKHNEKFEISKNYSKYIELLNKATIFTLDNLGDLKYDCNFAEVSTIPEGLLKMLKS